MKLKFVCFLIFIYFSYNDNDIENYLGKHQKLKTVKNYAIFDSGSFKKGQKMNFKLKSDSFCDEKIQYVYLDDLDDFGPRTSLPYNVSFSTEEFQFSKKLLVSKTQYFTIKKNEKEYNGQKGKYLLLYFACSGNIEIGNEKKKLNGGIIFLIIIIILLVLIGGGGAAFYFLYYKKKNKSNKSPTPNKFPWFWN